MELIYLIKNLLVEGNDLGYYTNKEIIGMIVKKVYRNETMISIYRIFANGNMRFMLSDQYKKYILKFSDLPLNYINNKR